MRRACRLLLAPGLLVPALTLGLPGAAAAAPLPPGTPPPANPASGLAVVRSAEAGHQTLNTTSDPLIQPDTTVEPSIAVNPADPQNAVTGYQMGRDDAGGDISNGFATTVDGGRTWTSGTVPGLTSFDPLSPTSPYKRASDAVVAFGGKDPSTGGQLVYYSSLVFDPTGLNLRSAILNSTSHDGGQTWDMPTVVQDDDGGGLNDKNWVVVDNGTGAGHHPGRVYVLWDRVAGVIAKYSDDEGTTWVRASPVFPPNVYAAQGIGVIPVVLGNGDLAVAYMADVAPPPLNAKPGDELAEAATSISHIVVSVARGAGSVATGVPLAFEGPVTVATYQGHRVRHQRAGGLVSAGVDPGGRFYVTWEDSRFRTDSNNDAVIAYSDDEGVRFSTPVRVNGGPAGDQVDHYNPAVAIGPGSTVRVMWRQRQETASGSDFSPLISTWIAQSTDRGATFAPAQRVDADIDDARFAAFSRGGAFQGDYDQVATGPDGTSWVVYCESAPTTAAEAAAPPAVPSAKTVHHQRTYVTLVAPPQPAGTDVPEFPLPAAALGLGLLVTPLAVRGVRRRRRAA